MEEIKKVHKLPVVSSDSLAFLKKDMLSTCHSNEGDFCA